VSGLRADGTEFPVEAAISQVGVEGHRYFTVILRDITQRMRAEEALAESERVHRTLLSNLSGMAYRCRNDKDWTMEFVSEGCEELTGYSSEDLVMNRRISFNSLIHPDDQHRVWDACQASLAARRPCSNEYRITTRTGEEKWVWDQAQGIYGNDGNLEAIEGLITDTTDRKRTAERLQQIQEGYRRLIEVSPDAIFVNRGDRIIFMNDQGLRLLGAVKAEEILGKSLFEVFHPDSHALIREHIHRLVEGEKTVPIAEEQIVKLDGEVVDVDVSAARFVDEEGMAILVVVRDVSERKRIQEQLQKAERLAELGTLASGMAHEIGTPMNVILGRAEYLMERVKEAPIRKGLETIVSQVERITKVMNQLLAFARRRPSERRTVDLRQAVEDNLDIFRERLAKQSIKLETELASYCPPVQADADQMSQVIINLVMNAIQAMPDGGTLRVGLMSDMEMVRLTVTDTGHGIPQEAIAKIFDPFFTTKEFGKGTGLGLTVVKGILEEHQGSIAVESEPEKGTTFTISLPVCSGS
jgi:PAS domain S-box-containing protein